MIDTEEVSTPLVDLNWWQNNPAERDEVFADLRRNHPQVFVPVGAAGSSPAKGFYALTRHADILEVSRRPEDFSSGEGTQIFDQPQKLREYRGSIIDMDNPEHARMRKIVSRGFTTRSLEGLRDEVEATVREILEEMPASGECDFVGDFAALLPLRIIDNMLGIPREHEKFILEATNTILGASDAEYIEDQTAAGIGKAVTAASEGLITLLRTLSEERIADPKDDLISRLVAATEGDNLTPAEMAKFFILLVGAGNETTRNVITHGLLVLSRNPDQRDTWMADYENYASGAIEEMLRWASPVVHMRRTVTRDGVRLGDKEFAKGDKVVLWYTSANRDDEVFEDPYTFDITRDPNPHLAFGAPGPHFCLGAHLARLELDVAFRELFTRYPDIEAVGEPAMLRSNFLNGIKHLRATYSAG
ncbi:cytochrome P450 (plasmid) [Rhodococcus erythropolis]|uniref:cytochrome P450 n=1 Tax=Rhodococcus TaxID=1827 RepID=UPI0005AB2BF6|nr:MULTISPECIES: cytochrome P450 [Rhodococcus]MCJ0949798.1 cytochrome P450 [Rhodococcus sp. ARC_M8]MDJ0441051.1 cytochrome P450 [Rhodococcus qingshengii]MDJ0489964.1 cytochrome P450 [Rhodococcus qingshengii]QEX08338.1 cytochrome P450 [Rhodococcus erythropolis]QOS66416.1 cytochrome P450 [Rhodococcus qingshengii]